jgi:VCBS repeat-containing protein
MTTKFRPRTIAVLAAFVGLLGVVAITIPSSGAAAPSVVRLNLGADGRYFEYGTTRQDLTTPRNGCQITSAEPVIALSSTGSQSDPGLGPDGIGVKQSPSSGNGTPCTQVERMETLTLEPGSSLSGKLFKGVRLDLEMTGNARVLLTFAGGGTPAPVTYELQTGTSIDPAQAAEWTPAETVPPYLVSSGPGDEVDACAAPNSSGPNSGANDNCQWSVWPTHTFATVTLTTSVGTVSLEGGGDFPTGEDRDTLLYLANSAPTAVGDTYSVDEDATLTGDVTDNDTDPEDDPLGNATATSGPSHGDLVLGSDGSFSYEPDDDFNGSDSFTYTVSDGTTTSNTATVTITVRPVNDAPVATSGTVTTPEETAVTVTVATDVDSTELDATCSSSGGGTITDNGDGTVDFTPPLDFNGTITLTCTVEDDEGAETTSSATVLVGVTGVNDAPVADDDEADTDADSAVTIDVLANDSDVDGDVLDVGSVADVLPAGASAEINTDGTVTYTPPSGYDGPGSFTYRATDGQLLSNVATVDVSVFPVICSLETVSDTDGDVTGSFTRLSDPFECKRYSVEALDGLDTVLFEPSGSSTVSYRGVLSFGPESAPAAGGSGEFALLLRYDPTGGSTFRPVQWCIDPQFEPDGDVTGATLPAGESWCVASGYTRGDVNGDLVTTWQVYGVDDPRFTR